MITKLNPNVIEDNSILPSKVKGLLKIIPITPDEILYTTTNNRPLTPNQEGVDIFGANIVSNTYENGKGVIKFDGDVTSIGEGAFRGCSSLTSVTIGNGVTSIGGGAFSGCTSLANIVIPDNVTEIRSNAFNGCNNLCIYLKSHVPVILDKAFEQVFTIYVPLNSLEAYKNDTNWSNQNLIGSEILNHSVYNILPTMVSLEQRIAALEIN